MATLLYRLGKTAYRRWPVFLAGWLVVIIGVGAFAAAFSKPMSDSFSIPGIPSEKAADMQAELFPGSRDAFMDSTFNVVVAAPEGHTLDEPAYSKAVDALVVDLVDTPQISADTVPLVVQDGAAMGDAEYAATKAAMVEQLKAIEDDAEQPPMIANPTILGPVQDDMLASAAEESGLSAEQAQANAAALAILAEGNRVGLITAEFDVENPMDIKPASQDAVHETLDTARDAGLVVEVNGSGMQSMEMPGGAAELIGIGIALLVLVLTFGSLVAAGLPIVTAVIGVGLGMTGITAMTAFMDIGSTTPILATMLGLAVGIDYALFILARFRNELDHTDDRQEAIGIAVGTAGSAVVFAGATVLIALSALSVVGIPFLTSMGLAAAATVLIAVLVALTLLPAVLGMLKRKSFGAQVRKYQPTRDEDGKILNNGVRWATLVGKKPIVAVIAVVIALGALAIPLKDLHLAFPTDSTAAADTTQRKASDLIAAAFGPGREAPMLMVVDATGVAEDQRQAKIDEVAAWANSQDGVRNAQVAGTNADPGDPASTPTGALVMVTPETGPDDAATEDLLAHFRAGQAEVEELTGTETGVTGLTAITVDVSERLADALPIYLSVVIGLAFILLMLVFRSILVPLTATLGFLLSVLATLGATVAVFQEGAFGLMEGQPIVSFMPIFLIGVVFGLAMDYQVFLVTRIREAHVHGASPRESVIDGFRGSARVVAAAAVIMTAVFAAFILMDDPMITMMGFALAIAIVFDAFVVRMTLIPALMYLMGEKAWWLPKWLDRILPNVDVEGEALERVHLKAPDDAGELDEELQPSGA
ncbi:MMPL family transporter [Nocardioides sp. AE5]|uniref:MMPL family transporter n=1 Tax=Nocardioides sp. AE5 TaxID=2962573 RepID=UPI00288226FC|nr:MMPL family transporter [Nocardioides sp. AE5]MDT0202372.1 MMPL family transporter [Nocardioides sp. AE5]